MAAQIWRRAVIHLYSRNGITVRFGPITEKDVPGFSHRVALLRGGTCLARDWLSGTSRPCARTAEFFAEKHGCFAGLAASPEGDTPPPGERRST